MSVNEKIALVTGASRGIGLAIAKKLAQKGATVIGTATTDAGAVAITEQLQTISASSYGLKLDVTDSQSIAYCLQHITEKSGVVQILINNAGITRDNILLRMKDEEWDAVVNTNLTAVFRITKPCLKPMFRARWGRIIVVGSVVGATGNVGQANYAAAKAGLSGFVKSLAQEIASRGITANMVSPGFIDTDMTKALPEAVKEELLQRIPMRQLGQAEDIANAVAFLASEEANYITGETIHINGGMHMA